MAIGCRFEAIDKRFGELRANDQVSFSIAPGTIHGVVGENGAGKSTIMKILYGLYQPDGGQVFVEDKPVRFFSPQQAIAAGIGMVHQHFMLVPTLTVWENVILGAEPTFGWLGKKKIISRLQAELAEFGMDLPLEEKVESLCLGLQQQVEIFKMLHRRARLLILDEPTAVLSPQETHVLFERLRKLRAQGHTIVIITHKLKEVLALTQAVTVMRRGKVVTTLPTAQLNEDSLAEWIVGRALSAAPNQQPVERTHLALQLKGVSTPEGGTESLQNISLNVFAGEIVGVAGIEGNGQRRLVNLLSQRERRFSGEIELLGRPLNSWHPYEKKQQGFSAIPLDRHEEGLILPHTIQENLALGHHWDKPWSQRGVFLREKGTVLADEAITQFDIRPANREAVCQNLSGGNQQKVILARETRSSVRFLLCCHPTRGVDVGAIQFIHQHLRTLRQSGAAILLVSSELDEIFALSDRIIVFYQGKLAGEVSRPEATEHQVGLWMTGGSTPLKGSRPCA